MERLWTETTTGGPGTENGARQGGQIPTKMDRKLCHDTQTILSRLVGKASQLISNETTNVAESWMHVRSKFDGGEGDQ